jgi:hypothetical protein
MARGTQRTTSGSGANRKIVWCGLTDEELKTAVLMKHPGESSRRWILPEHVKQSEQFGYIHVEPTACNKC